MPNMQWLRMRSFTLAGALISRARGLLRSKCLVIKLGSQNVGFGLVWYDPFFLLKKRSTVLFMDISIMVSKMKRHGYHDRKAAYLIFSTAMQGDADHKAVIMVS